MSYLVKKDEGEIPIFEQWQLKREYEDRFFVPDHTLRLHYTRPKKHIEVEPIEIEELGNNKVRVTYSSQDPDLRSL